MGYDFSMGNFNNFTSDRIDPKMIKQDKVETDVFNLVSDGVYQRGLDKFPIFDVKKNEFYKNMESSRNRLRFESDGKVSKYMRMSRYSSPFYIRYTDENGKSFLRKVK